MQDFTVHWTSANPEADADFIYIPAIAFDNCRHLERSVRQARYVFLVPRLNCGSVGAVGGFEVVQPNFNMTGTTCSVMKCCTHPFALFTNACHAKHRCQWSVTLQTTVIEDKYSIKGVFPWFALKWHQTTSTLLTVYLQITRKNVSCFSHFVSKQTEMVPGCQPAWFPQLTFPIPD